MKEILERGEYNFLKKNSDLQHVIYLVLSGSRAYGTSIDNSDYDLRGVCLEQPKYLYGLDGFEQFEDLPSDTVIYGLKKFASLLAKSNPNTLELLGVEEESIVLMTEQGKMIRDNAELFLSKRIINTFGNYALAQLRRLQNALCRDSYTNEKQHQHLQEVLSAQMNHFNRTYAELPDGAIHIYNDDESLKFDVVLNNYPIKDFVGIYSELASIVKSYSQINHRNRKKSEQALFKHGMHLIRLLITGTDILDGKGIITKRSDEQGLLLDIRNGKLSFDEIITLAEEYKRGFERAAETTELPEEPDVEGINQLMMEIYSMRALIS